MASYMHSIYGAMVNVTSLYGGLHGQGLRCKGDCNEFLWQLTESEFMVPQ